MSRKAKKNRREQRGPQEELNIGALQAELGQASQSDLRDDVAYLGRSALSLASELSLDDIKDDWTAIAQACGFEVTVVDVPLGLQYVTSAALRRNILGSHTYDPGVAEPLVRLQQPSDVLPYIRTSSSRFDAALAEDSMQWQPTGIVNVFARPYKSGGSVLRVGLRLGDRPHPTIPGAFLLRSEQDHCVQHFAWRSVKYPRAPYHIPLLAVAGLPEGPSPERQDLTNRFARTPLPEVEFSPLRLVPRSVAGA